MDEERISRYREKISIIEKRKDNIDSWIRSGDEKSILAVYKAYQELMEAFTDIFAMILRDSEIMVKDDYTNIERLREKNILDEEHEGLMKEANGLRNRLVHEYNGLERKLAIESIERINSEIEGVLEVIKRWLQKRSKD